MTEPILPASLRMLSDRDRCAQDDNQGQ